MNGDGGELHAWVDSGSYGSSQWVPDFVVEPVQEFGSAVFRKVLVVGWLVSLNSVRDEQEREQ